MEGTPAQQTYNVPPKHRLKDGWTKMREHYETAAERAPQFIPPHQPGEPSHQETVVGGWAC
jgi:hypothetical protein